MAVLTAGVALSAPAVSVSTVSQGSDNTVSIGYTLENAPAIVTFDVMTNAGAGVWASIGRKNLMRLSGDVDKVVSSGSGTVKWLCDHGEVEKMFASGAIKFELKAWSLDNPPMYMAVDLISGVSDGYERLRFYESEEMVPGGVVSNYEYRISTLLMRRCYAANVTWPMGASVLRDISNSFKRPANEKLHMVTLESDYYLGVFPVTSAQCALIQGNTHTGYYPIDAAMRIRDLTYYMTGGTPVRGANWPEAPPATTVLGKLRAKLAGKIDFDLPGEAQWEFAAHAGHYGSFWGNGKAYLHSLTNTDHDANLPGRYRLNQATNWMPSYHSSYSTVAPSIGVTNAVPIAGSYESNSWGFYDMCGGVWEWCLDWYQEDITALNGRVNVNLEDPTKCADGTSAGDLRVIRGGSWNSSANACRPEFRYSRSQNYAGDFAESGFRVCAPVKIK